MKRFVKQFTPEWIIHLYRSVKRSLRSGKRKKMASRGEIIRQSDIEKFLVKIGIQKGDLVMLHSSLSQLGVVDGGADTVIHAFENLLGAQGTLMMPSFPAHGYNYDYLKTDPEFDIRNTPARTGIITETFRKMNGVLRSFHPTDPVIAKGPLAGELVSEHYGQVTPYNPSSPFTKLCRLNGKIVLFGVDFNSLTNLHTLEDAVSDFKFPVYHHQEFNARMIDGNGVKSFMRTKAHDPEWSKKRKCNELIPLFLSAGCMKQYYLGKAVVYLINAGAMHDCMMKNYKERGVTMYTPNGS